MTEASRLVDHAQVWLNQVVARFAEAGVALPAKQFIANSGMEGLSYDEELLAVSLQRLLVGTPGAEGDPGSGVYFPLMAEYGLTLLRCVPTTTKVSGLTAAQLNASAAEVLTDLSLVASATNRAAVNGAWACERVRVGGGNLVPPQGGIGGVLYRVTITI